MTDGSDDRRDFFVSFNRADQAWAAWIAWTLEEAGYSVWYQHWDFAGNFVRDMDRAHEGSRRTLGVLSPDSAASGRAAITPPHAITGLGGVGKTTLALRYAYAHLADYDLIRWLPAEEPATLAAAYAGLAAPLGLDPATPDQPALIAAIRARLERTPRWLLVLDNATDPASLDPYLPRLGAGHVLVTSRRQDWGEAAGTLELDVLPEDEAVALLLGDAPADDAARAQAAALAAELGRLPLALAQAGAFMRARKLDVAAYRRQLA